MASVQPRKKFNTTAPLSPSLIRAKPKNSAKKMICNRFWVLSASKGFFGIILIRVSRALGITTEDSSASLGISIFTPVPTLIRLAITRPIKIAKPVLTRKITTVFRPIFPNVR